MRSHPRRHRVSGASCCLLTAAVVSLAGCAQILGIDELSRGHDAAPVDANPPIDVGAVIDAGIDARSIDTTCSEGAIDDATGMTPLDTAPAGNEHSASCGGESSPDQMLVWTAPVTDYYVFDTFGSGFDTVLALFEECGGAELACNNNVGNASQSELVRKFQQGEQALVLVDGAAGDQGQGTLNVQRVACPDSDLEGQSFPLELSTLGFGDDFESDCGGGGQEDRAYHWVAPADGLYYFRATSESFRPVVSLIDGPRCSDRVLACNAAVNREYGAEAVRFLRAGQSVSVVVDGVDGAGLFTLDIALRANQECPHAELPFASDPVADDFVAPTLSASCAPTRAIATFGELFEVADKVYSFEMAGLPGPSCSGQCNITVTARQSFTLYALEGNDCGGAEAECVLGDLNGGTATATLTLRNQAEPTFYNIVVADRFENDQGVGFDFTVVCSAIC